MSEYDTDILIWSEHQAELLRRVAAGEPLNEPPDWANIVEELGDVGRSELRSCRSLSRQALITGCATLVRDLQALPAQEASA